MLLSDAEIQSIKSCAHALANVARKVTLSYFRTDQLATENKVEGGFDPVTRADREAEEAMCAILAELRPDDAIFGEEFGVKEGTSGLTWVLDPIDGTRGFMSGTPTWGVLIAVGTEDGPIYGVIDQPYIGERFEGGLGEASTEGPQGTAPLRVRETTELSDAVLFTTFPEIGTKDEAAAFRRVAGGVKLVRYGMDCYAYALLAAGQIDVVVEAGLQPYDVQAPIAVIQAAGGIVTDWDGKPAHNGGQIVAAATPELHAAALAKLRQA
ncbi:histidinol-phosphatase [Falsihalocynthiibacter sp. SS001]|uniref:histidinol-phosphatase n=1 Tax=Falsihalocynthiibacter sp. SS001 TaxID=3349698 RepID=UPI0036D3047C